ncbi:MAG: GIY-YIG nuclease family protein [Pseudomonadota bacterium]|nr:GIY-YIG nuclease family protein [Pseudomonadota bacterium]
MVAYVYIVASKKDGALYIGVTTQLAQRMEQHAAGVIGHTARYNIRQLVHLEEFEDLRDAREREWRLKKWKRAWKVELIEASNPDWRDLRSEIRA